MAAVKSWLPPESILRCDKCPRIFIPDPAHAYGILFGAPQARFGGFHVGLGSLHIRATPGIRLIAEPPAALASAAINGQFIIGRINTESEGWPAAHLVVVFYLYTDHISLLPGVQWVRQMRGPWPER